VTSPQARAKSWGYQVEMAALEELKDIFPDLRRTGSVAYKKSAADLVQDGNGDSGLLPRRLPILPLVVTRDKRRPLLVTLAVEDLVMMVSYTLTGPSIPVAVQVKARERTWIGRLYDDLVKAVKK
jgi:hypothetical protein